MLDASLSIAINIGAKMCPEIDKEGALDESLPQWGKMPLSTMVAVCLARGSADQSVDSVNKNTPPDLPYSLPPSLCPV